MRLKLSRDIDWHDLPKIESPFFAASCVKYGDSYGDRVRGLDILGSGSSLSKKDQLGKIIDGLESGRIYLLKHTPTSPVFRWVKKGIDNGYWELSGSFGLSFNMSAEYMLRHIVRQHHLFQQRRYGKGNVTEEPVVPAMPVQSSLNLKQAPIKFKNLKWKDKDGNEIQKTNAYEIVYLTADVENLPDGNTVDIQIYEKDYNSENDYLLTLQVNVRDSKINEKWETTYIEDTDDINSKLEEEEKGYTLPEYIFILNSNSSNVRSNESAVLNLSDSIQIKVTDPEKNEPLKNMKYALVMPDGTIRNGTLDDEGRLIEDRIPPQRVYSFVVYDDNDKVYSIIED